MFVWFFRNAIIFTPLARNNRRKQYLHNTRMRFVYVIRIYIFVYINSITFTGLSDYRQTAAAAARPAELVVCPNGCGRHYVGAYSKYNLKKHLTFECGVEPMFSCPVCLRRFTRKEGLKRHMKLVHRTCLT